MSTPGEMGTEAWPLWEVFVRANRGLSHVHVGSLHAPDADMAVRNARDLYTRRNEGVSIWVVPADAITPTLTSAMSATSNAYSSRSCPDSSMPSFARR